MKHAWSEWVLGRVPQYGRQRAPVVKKRIRYVVNSSTSHSPCQLGLGRYQIPRAWHIVSPSSEVGHGAWLEASQSNRSTDCFFKICLHLGSCRKPIHTPSEQPIATSARPSGVSNNQSDPVNLFEDKKLLTERN